MKKTWKGAWVQAWEGRSTGSPTCSGNARYTIKEVGMLKVGAEVPIQVTREGTHYTTKKVGMLKIGAEVYTGNPSFSQRPPELAVACQFLWSCNGCLPVYHTGS